MNWQFWKSVPQTTVRIVNRDRHELRLSEWQQDKNLVSSAIRELSRAELQLMLDVVRNEHPGQRVYADDCNPNIRIVAQARAEGYTMALANLEALGRLRVTDQIEEPTFEPEEIDIKKK